jgi:Mrp family chromosome partitioning ATPase
LVSRRGKTRKGQLEEAISVVRAARKPVLGVVLNGSDRTGLSAYGYRQGYRYAKPRKSS